MIHLYITFNMRLISLISILVLTSCSHYNLVTTENFPFETIYVHIINNDTYAPNIHVIFQNQIRESIVERSPIRISKDSINSDVQLQINLSDYKRGVSSRSSSDPGRFNALNLSLDASFSLYDNRKDAYIVKNATLTESAPIYFDQESQQDNTREVEYQKLPILTRKLADSIVNQITSNW